MAIATRTKSCQTGRFFWIGAILLLASACDAPAFVEGIVEESRFTVRDDNPELRPQADDGALVVLAQKDWDMLRVVTLSVPDFEALGEETTLTLGSRRDGGAWLEVAQGPIDESVRSDGVKVLNTLTPRFVDCAGGTAVITRVDGQLLGTFEAELEDGGWLEGAFTIELE